MVEVQRQHCSIQPEALKVSLGRAVSDDPPSLISNARGMLSPHFAEAAGLAQSQVPSVPGNIQVPLGSSCWGVKEEKKTNPSINREYNPGRWRSHAGVHTRPGYISAPQRAPETLVHTTPSPQIQTTLFTPGHTRCTEAASSAAAASRLCRRAAAETCSARCGATAIAPQQRGKKTRTEREGP